MVKAREKVIEVRVALVAPMELHSMTQRKAAVVQLARLYRRREQTMERRHPQLTRQLERRLCEQPALLRSVGEKTAAADRRKRNGAQQLRVILQAVSLVRVGPRPVEDIFAI